MRVSVFSLFLFSFFTLGVSRAQEIPRILPDQAQTVSPGQATPTIEPAPPAESQTIEEQHPRLFWIFPTYTVADSKSPSPLTTHGKWRLFAKDTTDPFTFGWAAFEAALAQANNDFPGYGQGAAGYGKRFGAALADDVGGAQVTVWLEGSESLVVVDRISHRMGEIGHGHRFGKRKGRALPSPR